MPKTLSALLSSSVFHSVIFEGATPYFWAKVSNGTVSLSASTATLALKAAVNFAGLAISFFFFSTKIMLFTYYDILVVV